MVVSYGEPHPIANHGDEHRDHGGPDVIEVLPRLLLESSPLPEAPLLRKLATEDLQISAMSEYMETTSCYTTFSRLGPLRAPLLTGTGDRAFDYLHPEQREDDNKEKDEHKQIRKLWEHADEGQHDLVEPVPYAHQSQDPAREHGCGGGSAQPEERLIRRESSQEPRIKRHYRYWGGESHLTTLSIRRIRM